jgi:general secretion pathway protein G
MNGWAIFGGGAEPGVPLGKFSDNVAHWRPYRERSTCVCFLTNMKPNHHLGGNPDSKGAIRWGCACFILAVICGLIIFNTIFVILVRSPSPELSQVECDFKSLESGLAMYKLNAGNYPSTAQGLKALVEKPTDYPVPVRWVQIMPKIPLDPWGNPYAYRFPGSHDPMKPVFISCGPDEMIGTGDDLSSDDE